ncbi:hypothetical protein [Streptomyces olivaceoviridis]|uniref:hypothetical protein n=1 Tax=Streptomyces olivaceoviridis TaxID=1921 RepID=UPI0036FB8A85
MKSELGSKENLFAKVVNTSFTPRIAVPDDLTHLSHGIVRALVDRTRPGADELSPFLPTLRSVSHRGYSAESRHGNAPHSRSR